MQPPAQCQASVATAALPRRVVAAMHDLTYTEFDAKTWYSADDWPTLMRLNGATIAAVEDGLSSARRAGTIDESLYLAELDELAKIACNQRYKGFAPFRVGVSYPAVPGLAQASAITLAACELGGQLVARVRADPRGEGTWWPEAVYPTTKAKGAGFFRSGREPWAVIPLCKLSASSSCAADLDALNADLGGAPLHLTLFTRGQPAASPKPHRSWDGMIGSPVVEGNPTLYRKTRKVQGQSFNYNLPLTESTTAVTWAAKADPLEITLGGKASFTVYLLPKQTDAAALLEKLLAEGWRAVSYDAKDFDDSMGAASIDLHMHARGAFAAAATIVNRGLFNPRLVSDIYGRIARQPLLAPPTPGFVQAAFRPNEYGRAYDSPLVIYRVGGVPSGVRPTSILDSMLNAEIVSVGLYNSGVKRAILLCFGDDLVILVETEANMALILAQFVAKAEELGVLMTKAADVSFLKRHYPGGYMYLARAVAGTLQRETRHEPEHLVVAALGIAARRANLRGHPLAGLYDRLLDLGVLGQRNQQAYNYALAASFDVAVLGRQALVVLAANSATADSAYETAQDLIEHTRYFEGPDGEARRLALLSDYRQMLQGDLARFEHVDRLVGLARERYPGTPAAHSSELGAILRR